MKLKLTAAAMVVALLVSCSSSSDPPTGYENQALNWQACSGTFLTALSKHPGMTDRLAALGGRARCAYMQAPLDYENPSRGGIQVALLRVTAATPQQRLGAIAINPGGPGEDGLYTALVYATMWDNAPVSDPAVKALFRQMSERYDLIGFSPRGVGASTNLTCPAITFSFETPVVLNETQANFDIFLNNSRLTAQSCGQNPQTSYMNTETTAKDLELLRSLLGDSKLNYLGISYGTWLGTWYAGLYPERVGRMLLIGNTDITAPLNTVLLQQGMGDQRVLDQVLVPYAADRDDLFHLGNTTAAVQQSYLSLKTLPGYLLAATTASINISDSSRADQALLSLLAAKDLQDRIQNHPGDDKAAIDRWINSAEFVHTQARDQARELNEAYFRKVAEAIAPQPEALTGESAIMWAVSCNDSGAAFGIDRWVEENRTSASRNPFFGGVLARNACLYWDAPILSRPSIQRVASAGNLLMLQSQLDPWTVVEGAVNTFNALPNASMILVENEYTHALHVPYNSACIDRPIAEYFLFGTPPPRLTLCPGNAPK